MNRFYEDEIPLSIILALVVKSLVPKRKPVDVFLTCSLDHKWNLEFLNLRFYAKKFSVVVFEGQQFGISYKIFGVKMQIC